MTNLGLKEYVYWKWIKQLYPNYVQNKKKVRLKCELKRGLTP